ncbi:hypothetical protein Nepgr_032983 [Nepenthes gracilis]|uniref:Uncharacterized protein n=1 Tax=Nepenthes gracilis TaxID=150966 RepID=A0AAD3Y826_NEPGR|nr:hypothetical protein Nepgr_032983 [Nepenthes gracilis]
MSLSYSECFPDLLCDEDSDVLSGGVSPGCSSELETTTLIEESVAGLIEDERNYAPGGGYLSQFRFHSLDVPSRAQSVAWMLKVRSFYGFQPGTAYLSVNYFDRILYSHRFPQTKGWPLQLLSVACLSLAAKMEEPVVPSLLDLQVESAKFFFQPRSIQRMELFILHVLDWRLRSITPFSFLSFFAYKVDASGNFMGFLHSRANDIILSNIQDTIFLEHWPSSIAAAAILCAASEIPNLSVTPEHAESWCDGLKKDRVLRCYRLMQQCLVDRRKPPRVIPQFRIMTLTNIRPNNSSPSSSSSSASSSCKRRKLNNWSWVDDDNGNSD